MPWVRFVADFDWKPRVSVTQAFLAGQERQVTTPCAVAAVAAGKAVRMKKAAHSAIPVETKDDENRSTQ